MTFKVGDEDIVIPNGANIPQNNYNAEDDNEGEWQTYHSRKYLRKMRKKEKNRKKKDA